MRIKIATAFALTVLLLIMIGPILSGQGPQGTQPATTKSLEIVPISPSQPYSGAQMFKDYCASCHGPDGRGNGPAAVFLKTPPPDLRMMAQSNAGKYPAGQVKAMLRFGPGSHARGALDMPTWGQLFHSTDVNERVTDLRVYNLTKFIGSIQEK